MTAYTKSTDFAIKDSLLSGNPSKVVRGTEINTEFVAIQAADADNVKISGLATGVVTFLATPSSANLAAVLTDETGSGAAVFATSPTLVTPALGTPSALVGTNITGTAAGLTAGNVTTNANLTGHITSVGNAAVLGSFTSAQLATALTDETGSGAAVFANSPTLVTPALGTPASGVLTNATGLPIATGVAGLGTGIATALAVNVGTAGAPVVNGGALGTPSSGVVTNLTGTASININGTVGATTPAAGTFTTLTITGTLKVSTGAAVGGATPGLGGVAFPAIAVAVTNANTLDDYEQGTFVPTIAFGGAAVGVTYTSNLGQYVKIGKVVHFQIGVILSSKGSSTGAFTVVGLPFTPDSITYPLSFRPNGMTSGVGDTYLVARVNSAAATISCGKYSAGSVVDFTDADFTNGSFFTIAGHYEI